MILVKQGIRTGIRRNYGLLYINRRNFSFEPQVIVSTLTDSMQALHSYTGIPWWALIPITTFSLRSIWTLPLAVLQRKRVQRQAELRPIVNATNPVLKLNLAKKVQIAKLKAEAELKKINENKSDNYLLLQLPLSNMKYEEILLLATKETRKRQKALFKKHNVQIWKNFILPAFQIPLWVCMSLTMRNLSGWSSWDSVANKPLDPSLYTEGALWITDLTCLDSMHILPLILGVISLCNVEWTFKTFELLRLTQKSNLRPTLMDSVGNLSRMSVVFMMAISFTAPAALVLYWLSSQAFSLIQNVIMDLLLPISFTPNKRLNYKENKLPNAEDVIRY